MSTYEYINGDRRFSADTALNGQCVFVTAQPTGVPLHGMWIPNADVPTVAAELLKAAGYPALAELIESAAREAAEKAEAEAAEKKLQERRDALATELCGRDSLSSDYRIAGAPIQKAIDRIIELEDGASRD